MRVAAHGTVSMYTNKNCRCEDCTVAWRQHYRILRFRSGKSHTIPGCSACGSIFAAHKCGGVGRSA